MKRFTKFGGIALAVLLAAALAGCNTPHTDTAAPDLVLKSLSIFGQDAKSGSIEVDYAKSEVTANDVVAVFDYGTEKDKPLAVEVTKGTLNVGANTVTLTVKAVAGKYKGWTKEITVTRKAASMPPSAAPDLVLKSLSIFGKDAKGGSIEVENAKSEVTADDVVAKFNYGTVTDEELKVTVANGTLNVGANTVTLTVKAVAGKYKGWTKEITVTRAAASVPSGTPAEHAVTMVPVTLPAGGHIVGAAPAAGTPSSANGVFIAGRTVTLSGFEMAESETAYALWKEVYEWATHADRGANKYTFANGGTKGKDGTGSETEPVTEVSWRDCIVWCNAYTEMIEGKADNCVYLASAGGAVLRDATNGAACDAAFFDKTKKGYRLPTEAEWEYAARANADGTLNPLNRLSGAEADYNDAEACKKVAWYDANSGSKTHPVKEKTKNGQNLYDMSGNVWEWCWDWDGTVEAGTETDPIGAPSGLDRVGRGGGWYGNADSCLPGDRGSTTPDIADGGLGFRLCRSRS